MFFICSLLLLEDNKVLDCPTVRIAKAIKIKIPIPTESSPFYLFFKQEGLPLNIIEPHIVTIIHESLD